MTDVWIKYNPYNVQTEIKINGVEITPASPLFYVTELRLQSWIEARGHWNGIFPELKRQTGDHNIQVRFHGTAFDFADLKYAAERYGDVFDTVELLHVNQDTCEKSSQDDKLEQMKALYQELQEGPIEEFKSPDIQNAFSAAIDTDFKIVVVAPMSSGKSTLINAILGHDLLPAINEATTAVVTHIRDNDDAEKFTVTSRDIHGQPICFKVNEDGSFAEDEDGRYILAQDGVPIVNVNATPNLIEQLNSAIDPEDDTHKRALAGSIEIEGPIPALPSTRLRTVFIDTPGGNNAQNEEHGRLMTEAIQDEEKSLILYVFNGTQTGTNDSDEILREIAAEMVKSNNGKQSRDRFLFAANRMDDFDTRKEDYQSFVENRILPGLSKYGIQEPNLFLVSARLAKLLRMREAGEELTKKDKVDLAAWLMAFGDMSDGDESYCLYRYSSITDHQKEEFNYKVRALAEQGDENAAKIAEINSGVPALEMSIRDYVEKYAISIKIKNAHDSFMRKVKSRKMVEERKKMWASSQENLREVQGEIAEKRKAYEENKTLASFRSRIDAIRIDKKRIYDYEARLRADIDRLGSRQKNIKKSNAETVLRSFRNSLESTLQTAGRDLVKILNEEVLKPCGEVVDAYADYVQSLDNQGFLNLGGIKVRELDGFQELSVCSVDDMLGDDSYTFEKRVKTGTESYKKSGFFNACKRLFGVSSGWGTRDTFEDVEYVKVADLIRDKITESMEMFHAEIEKSIKDTEAQVSAIKKQTHKRLDKVDKRIADLMKLLAEKLSNEQKLRDEVSANAKNFEWITDFVARVEAILEVE